MKADIVFQASRRPNMNAVTLTTYKSVAAGGGSSVAADHIPTYIVDHHRDGCVIEQKENHSGIHATELEYNIRFHRNDASEIVHTFSTERKDSLRDQAAEIIADVAQQVVKNEFDTHKVHMAEPMAGIVFHEVALHLLEKMTQKKQGYNNQGEFGVLGVDTEHDNEKHWLEKDRQIDGNNVKEAVTTVNALIEHGKINHKDGALYLAHLARKQLMEAQKVLTPHENGKKTLVSEHAGENVYRKVQTVELAKASQFMAAAMAVQANATDMRGNTFPVMAENIQGKIHMLETCMESAQQAFKGEFRDKGARKVAEEYGKGAHARRLSNSEARLGKAVETYVATHGMPKTPADLVKFAGQMIATQKGAGHGGV